MDIATRYQPRTRGQSFLDREKETEPSQVRMEDPFARRRSSRPAPVSNNDDTNTFRKPSFPASATRQSTNAHQKQPSASYGGSSGLSTYANPPQYKQRTNVVARETRVPSGPRDYPASPAKRTTSTTATQFKPSTDAHPPSSRKPALNTAVAPELPFSTNDTFEFSPQEELTRGFFGNPGEDLSEPTTPASQRDRTNSTTIDFLPSVNFDEFQSSLSTLDTNTRSIAHMYDDFPAAGTTRVLRSDTTQPARAVGKRSLDHERPSSVSRKLSLTRGNSFRERNAERLSKVPKETKSSSSTGPSSSTPGPIARATAALKARRQSNAGTLASNDTQRLTKSSKPLRSAFGPSTSTNPQSANAGTLQPPVKQTGKLSTTTAAASSSEATKSRRITMSNFESDHNRLNVATNLQPDSRRTKGLSLLPPALDSDPNTPTAKSTAKGASRSRTPSSSGNNNRRQSIASGRLSGLGARTVSPTDTRRQKRLSMAPQQPPLPTHSTSKVSPSEEVSMQQHLQRIERNGALPRSTTVPNMTGVVRREPSSHVVPDSARFSTGDVTAGLNKFGYPFPATSTSGTGGLSAKSSYTSLHTAANAASAPSRVPILRSRTAASTATTGSSGDESQASTEVIPPVPAIPKAYDSPKDAEPLPFGQQGPTSKVRKGSAPHLHHMHTEAGDGNHLSSAYSLHDFTRASFDSDDRARGTASKKSAATRQENDTRPLPLSSISTGPLETSASFSGFPQRPPANEHGRQNGNLQPPRLPPLNLVPLTLPHRAAHGVNGENGPRPSQELDDRHHAYALNGAQTPEWPRHGHKTPSTPMTASKATFLRRAGDGDTKYGVGARSSTSHFALRDAVGIDPDAMRTGWLDDSDDDAHARGISIATPHQPTSAHTATASRSAITPFASGSLPKGSGESSRYHGQHSVDWTDDFSFSQPSRQLDTHIQTKTAPKTSRPSVGSLAGSMSSLQSPADTDQRSPATENADKDTPNSKKEGGGLRRKLSLGWRRSSSKAANHADNQKGGDPDTPKSAKDAARTSSMVPPKLPASVAFNGDGSLGIPLNSRPSLDGSNNEPTSLSDRLRRRTFLAAKQVAQRDDTDLAPDEAVHSLMYNKTEILEVPPPKTRSLHSERAQPVSNNRSSSWGSLNRSSLAVKPYITQPKPSRHGRSTSTINALVKDSDDLAADEEMRRLTQKKKDVDNVAKMTDELMRRAAPRDPVPIDRVLHDRQYPLNIFERGEVIEYENEGIYFTGTSHAKKIVGDLHPAAQPTEMKGTDKSGKSGNYGYDDERGDYNIVIGDHLAYRYEVCDVLGKGSFGQVVRCIDHKEGGVVAVKIIRNKKRFHQQALVEVGILGKLRDWDPDGAHATLSITGSFYFRSHLCIVTPCLSINLYELIRAHNFSGFTLPLIRRFARQLLACLVLLQEKRVIHCDLKPENILLCSARAADVRVIDFGSSCREEEKVYTYIQSRFYRSPEVILGSSYGLGIDMWSFGCILAELWTGYPIFPGENEQEQLACIMEIFGPPDRHLVERCTRKKLFFDSVGKPRVTVSSKGRRRRPSSKTLQQALKTDDEAFVDFIARCLRWDPDRRMKPNEACAHAFVTNQPLNQRPGIPDEARRAARVRSTAAVPTTTTASSPVKRLQPQHGSTSSLQSNSSLVTPHKVVPQSRQVLDTPQTALRAPTINTSSALQSSPVRAAGNRRQSNLASAGSAAALKRQSNAAAMTGSSNLPMSKTTSGLGSLAEKAARESMAATAANNSGSLSSNGSGRWRV